MASPGLRRQPTLPMDLLSETPPRKILKAKRRLTGRSSTATSLVSMASSTPLIKPSLSRKGTSKQSMSMKCSSASLSLTKNPSLTKKASITKEQDDIATAAIALDSGSHIGKTGVITEDDIGPEMDVTVVDASSTFSETGGDVTTSLKKTLSGTGSLSKKLSRKQSSRAAGPYKPPMPPGGLVEIAFSFDTTGSMSAALKEVKGRIKDIVQKLQSDVPGIRIAIFAHGDYCDKDIYIVKWIDFGATLPELHDFVNNCEDTGGGDGPECYELVLRRAHEVLSWTPGSKRSLVIIGDDIPHEPGYKYGDFTNDINWRDECSTLKDKGIRVYGVAVKAGLHEQQFYQEIARRTDGLTITLDKFDLIFDLMMAICYREGGDELFSAYQDELKEKYGVSKLGKSLSGMFSGLGASTSTGLVHPGPLTTTSLFGGLPTTTGAIPLPFTHGLFGTPRTTGLPTAPFPHIPLITPMTPFGTPRTTGLFGSAPPISPFGAFSVAVNTMKLLKGGKGKKIRTEETFREKINDKKFKKTKPLNRLTWSNWKLAMTSISLGKWAKWLNGYITKQLFSKDLEKAAVYEFGVQRSKKGKTYVVGFKVVDKLPLTGKWCAQLVGRKDLKEKFKQAVAQGASVSVRRAIFKKRNKKFIEKVKTHLSKMNYAFGTTKKNSRILKIRGGFVIN